MITSILRYLYNVLFKQRSIIDDVMYIRANIKYLDNIYNTTAYITPIESRCGNITQYTEYIRRYLNDVSHGKQPQSYEHNIYANMCDWLNIYNVKTKTLLWLDEVNNLITYLEGHEVNDMFSDVVLDEVQVILNQYILIIKSLKF